MLLMTVLLYFLYCIGVKDTVVNVLPTIISACTYPYARPKFDSLKSWEYALVGSGWITGIILIIAIVSVSRQRRSIPG